MKNKKLITFMLILSTLFAYCNMSISAGNLWEGTTYYSINGIDFVYYYYEYDLERYFGKYQKNSAYIKNPDNPYPISEEIEEQIYYIYKSLYLEDKDYYEYDAFAVKTMLDPAYTEGYDYALLYEYSVYIDEQLYELLNYFENTTIPFENTETIGGIKTYFNYSLVTLQPIINNMQNWWIDDNGNLTLLSWLAIAGFGIVATVNIIKLIKIKRKE